METERGRATPGAPHLAPHADGAWLGRRTAVLALAALLAAWQRPGHAAPLADAPNARGNGDCAEAAARAAQAWDLPEGLLLAIGRAETGRVDPASGRLEPFPFAVDAAGDGRYFDSADAAIAYVRDRRARGVRSIDVGCFQVNLAHHPGAFMSLREAFDPTANAMAAARFLADLHRHRGDWPSAVALYHSATPALGQAYRMRVEALRKDGGGSSLAARGGSLRMAGRMAGGRDPVVALLAPGAAGIAVFTPSRSSAPAAWMRRHARFLPRVFRPE